MRWGKRNSRKESVEAYVNEHTTATASTTAKKPRKVAGKTETEDGKDISRMSDKELRDRINRINMEQQYSKLTEPSYPPVKNGMDHFNTAMSLVGKANQVYGLWNSPVAKLARGAVATANNNRRADRFGLPAGH